MSREEEALGHMRAALAIDPARIVTLRNLADELRPPASLILLDSAVRLDPTQARSYSVRASHRALAGDTAGARADAAEALRYVSSDTRPMAWVVQGNIALLLGDSAAARAAVARAMEALPPAGPLGNRMLSLGRLLFVLGEIDTALDMLERIRPRGALIWFAIMDARTDFSALPERAQQVLEEARPPWVGRP